MSCVLSSIVWRIINDVLVIFNQQRVFAVPSAFLSVFRCMPQVQPLHVGDG